VIREAKSIAILILIDKASFRFITRRPLVIDLSKWSAWTSTENQRN
jgi:hypothetical protein